MNWKPELDDLARREAFAREMGGADKVKRQRDQGLLTVRERIDKLTDAELEAVAGGGSPYCMFTGGCYCMCTGKFTENWG